MTSIDTEPYSRRIIGYAIEVHRTLGSGLIESIYEAALCKELNSAGLRYKRQQELAVFYKGVKLDLDFNLNLDLLVEDAVVVEVKSVQVLLPIHEPQLHMYLKVSGNPAGLLLNFNGIRFVDGVRRRLLSPGPRLSRDCGAAPTKIVMVGPSPP